MKLMDKLASALDELMYRVLNARRATVALLAVVAVSLAYVLSPILALAFAMIYVAIEMVVYLRDVKARTNSLSFGGAFGQKVSLKWVVTALVVTLATQAGAPREVVDVVLAVLTGTGVL